MAISVQERKRLLRFARNDIKRRPLSYQDVIYSKERALESNILGISPSPLHGSFEMTSIIEEFFPSLSEHPIGVARDKLRDE